MLAYTPFVEGFFFRFVNDDFFVLSDYVDIFLLACNEKQNIINSL